MANEAIKEILKKESSRFTSEELEAIMDEEVSKPVAQMDVELVDICVDLLTQRLDEKEGDNSKIVPISKIPANTRNINKNNKKIIKIIVAAILVSAFFAIMAGAGKINIPDGLFGFNGDSYKLNSQNDEIYSDLATELKKHNLQDLVLPRYLYDECKISGFEVVEDENNNKNIRFVFNNVANFINGNVEIIAFSELYFFADNEVNAKLKKYNDYEIIKCDNIEINCYSNSFENLIYYDRNNLSYNIFLYDCDFNIAKSIAATIE